MILDSSALLAIVFREPGFKDLLDRLEAADSVAAGAPTLAETGIVLHARLGDASRGLLERLLNFGDCLTYATAALAVDALIYVGDDFARTDLEG